MPSELLLLLPVVSSRDDAADGDAAYGKDEIRPPINWSGDRTTPKPERDVDGRNPEAVDDSNRSCAKQK